jgi:hypothetical protein
VFDLQAHLWKCKSYRELNSVLILLYAVVLRFIPILLTLPVLQTGSLIYSHHGPGSTENTCHVSECVSIDPLPSTRHGSDHTENTSSVVSYNHSARNTAENSLYIVVWRHWVRENVFRLRCISTFRARTMENTAPELLATCVFRELPSNGSLRHIMLFLLRGFLSITPILVKCPWLFIQDMSFQLIWRVSLPTAPEDVPRIGNERGTYGARQLVMVKHLALFRLLRRSIPCRR